MQKSSKFQNTLLRAPQGCFWSKHVQITVFFVLSGILSFNTLVRITYPINLCVLLFIVHLVKYIKVINQVHTVKLLSWDYWFTGMGREPTRYSLSPYLRDPKQRPVYWGPYKRTQIAAFSSSTLERHSRRAPGYTTQIPQYLCTLALFYYGTPW